MNFHTPEPTELSLALPIHCNTPDEVIYEHIRDALGRGLPILRPVAPHDVPAIIVGGGPSVKDELPNLARLHVGTVYALNGAGLWLQSVGITPHAVILLDARPHNVKFITGLDPRVKLYIATQCHPDVFDAALANGNPIITWHSANREPTNDEKDAQVGIGVTETRYTVLIAGGSSVGMRALRLVHVLGHRTVHLFGYDSSYANSAVGYDPPSQLSHAYPQPENEKDEPRGCLVGGRWFVSTAWMIRQAADFQHIAAAMMAEGMNFRLYGDGLLQAMANEALKGEPEAFEGPPIDPTAKIHEKAFIGEGVRIGARTAVYQFASVIRGAVLGADCKVAPGVCVDGARFGDRCAISQGVALSPGFKFGNDVFIGPNVSICNDFWPSVSKENFDMGCFQRGEWAVIVKDGAAIGANAVILPGVTIGERALVAAGAVVTKSVPDDHLYQRDGTAIPINPPWRLYRMRFAQC